MKRTRLSLYYLIGYLWPTGLALLAAPRFTMKLLMSNADYGDVMPRAVGMFMVGLAVVVTQLIRMRAEMLYRTTLIVRGFFLACIFAIFLYSRDPFFMVVFGVVALGVALTGASYLLDRRDRRAAAQAGSPTAAPHPNPLSLAGPRDKPQGERGTNAAAFRFDADRYQRAVNELNRRFAAFRTDGLKGIGPEEFERRVRSQIGAVDGRSEGYGDAELSRQRDFSTKFRWGHDHDFGGFRLEGAMGERHVVLLGHFVAMFPVALDDFDGKDVLDVGCWTGGTTLALASLGARVVALEEVRKYADMAAFLAGSFGLAERVSVRAQSLYACNTPEFRERFDVAYFPGVIYHLSDPVVALRILYNSLRPGGILLVESAGIDSPEPICRFDGTLVHNSGSLERLDRTGWNSFMPSPLALERMMREAGFDDVESVWHPQFSRIYAFARKTSQVGICRAGLSVPDIP